SESVDSRSASVYALRPTSISKEPEDVKSNTVDGIVFLDFDAHVNGMTIDEAVKHREIFKIQWFRILEHDTIQLNNNNNIYSGTYTNKLSINIGTLPDTSEYFAIIEGKCGIDTTRITSVIKNFNAIELKLKDLDACIGNIYSIKTQISNPQNHPLEFRWFKNGKAIYYKENLKGLFSDELIFNPIYIKDSGKYKLEARIKDTKHKVYSNEIEVNVGKAPKIVCVRIDTMISKSSMSLTSGKGTYKGLQNSWVSIFYEGNKLPIKFELYKNGNLIRTLYSDSSIFSLGNIQYLEYINDNLDSSKFWVIAQNQCGYDYSDTISIFNQTICNPFNQFFDICQNEPFTFKINYKYVKPLNEYDTLDIRWEFINFVYCLVPTIFKDSQIALDSIFKDNWLNVYSYDSSTTIKVDAAYWANHRVDTNNIISSIRMDEFCCYYMNVRLTPIISRQPVNKQLRYGDIDTIIYINFDNEFEKKIEVELYHMASLNNKPRLVDRAEPEWGRWYSYIKNVTNAEDGYYYAVTRYNNGCNPVISDTVRVTVIPNGSTTSVSDLESNSGLLIQPNPSSDFITIQFQPTEGFEPSEGYKVQILDVLGIEVMSVGTGLDLSQQRIDVSHLPAGVYFIRIGDKVEKFVKM
ncbi:MAG: T9SS type A sorting domain-containing protein, partial [Candidatus Kapaibacterium sp.]